MFSYKPFKKTLIDRNLAPIDLVKNNIITLPTLSQINKGKFVSMRTIDSICQFLNCKVEDVIEHTPS